MGLEFKIITLNTKMLSVRQIGDKNINSNRSSEEHSEFYIQIERHRITAISESQTGSLSMI